MRHASAAARSWSVLTIALAAMFAFTVSGYGRSGSKKGNAAVVTQTGSFGSLVPTGFGAPAIVSLPFRLSIPKAMAARGYRLNASSNFVFSPSRPADGGKSLSASDVGVGIAGIASTLGANADIAVSEGFDYDPAVARRANGSSHYAGAAAGRANLADLLAGRDILRVGKIPPGILKEEPVDLTLTVTLAVQSEFLTPGGFSGTITLIAAE